MTHLVRYLRAVAFREGGDRHTDADLLEAFLNRRDEAAFETLLRRHGPMVLGVCRRTLGNTHDAEDAFQATFLVLVRKAATIRPRELIGNWLYGVACRTARKARAMNAKRRIKECRAQKEISAPEPEDKVPNEILERLDAEISRLPDKYRLPVVLCELQGKSRKEAARLLGLAEGTLSWRLAWARKTLARRLARPGVPLSAGALTAALSEASASATLPPTLMSVTARAAVQAAAGRILSAGVVSAQVITLTEGVLKAMLLSKLKLLWILALAVSLGAGATGMVYRAAAADPAQTREAPQRARLVLDDLEELRLEVQALRKGLESTRARVKSLEAEVDTLKRQQRVTPMQGSGQGMPGGGILGFQGGGNFGSFNGGTGFSGGGGFAGGGSGFAGSGGSFVPSDAEIIRRYRDDLAKKANQLQRAKPKATPDPLADAEQAIKELRQHPGNKQATEQLERALQALKGGSKQKEEPKR